MLTGDAGPKLAKPGDLSSFVRDWASIMTGYAELQMQLSSVAGLPAPDSRPQTLARRFGAVAEPLVATLGDAIPQSLVHLDVTPKNVCTREGNAVFIDWGEAAIAHPFCGLVKPLRALVQLGATPGGGEILRVRDAYLEPWTVHASARELRRIVAAAYSLGALCYVAAIERKLASFPADSPEQYARTMRKRFSQKMMLWRNLVAELALAPDRLGL
jgi:hypothetical protein